MNLRKDEYINPDDGLIYCKHCRTPRQYRFVMTITGQLQVKRILCECLAMQAATEQKDWAYREQVRRVDKWKTSSLQDPLLSNHTFDLDKGFNQEQINWARKYVNAWNQMEAQGKGLLLWGAPDSGKSFIAGCIANALIEQGVTVLMTTLTSIINLIGSRPFEERGSYMADLNKYELLIIDNFGRERDTDYVNELIETIIDNRYRSKKPLIITTNLSINEMKSPKTKRQMEIYNSIREMCIPISVNCEELNQTMIDDNIKNGRIALG